MRPLPVLYQSTVHLYVLRWHKVPLERFERPQFLGSWPSGLSVSLQRDNTVPPDDFATSTPRSSNGSSTSELKWQNFSMRVAKSLHSYRSDISRKLTARERLRGFEPLTTTWRDGMLPLNTIDARKRYTRLGLVVSCLASKCNTIILIPHFGKLPE